MARRIFHSFRYRYDAWRVQNIRQMGSIEGQKLLSANGWEEVKKGGDDAIQRWIDEQMKGKSCVVVLIGQATAGRKWVKHEMRKGWADGKGVLGIHIHNLKDADGNQARKGRNPLDDVTVSTRDGNKSLSSVAKAYDPPYSTSQYVYNHIKDNIEDWIERAIEIRQNN